MAGMALMRSADYQRAVYIIEERANPSTDFFVLPVVAAGRHHVTRCSFADLPAAADLTDAVVIFVRYIPPAWARLVAAQRSKLRAVIFFMDDDVLDLDASIGMPWRYHFKLARLAAWRLRWLRRQKVQLWVSTPYLQQKYADWRPKLVLPSPVATPADVCRVFYHGSASHDADIRWLHPVVEAAMQRDERIAFEIIGGQDIYRLYKGLPRVTVVHPMKWTAYQTFLVLQERHIGLNPLQDLPFNRARSYTKFFDITRCKAVGIYSPDTACANIISHGQDGLIVELDQEAWVTAILNLARNPSLRQTLWHNAELKMQQLAEQSQYGYAGLIP